MTRGLISMMVAAVLAVACVGCVAPAALAPYSKARTVLSTIVEVRDGLARARSFVAPFIPLLLPGQAERLDRLGRDVDEALAIAADAATLAERAAAAERAARALDQYRFAAGA